MNEHTPHDPQLQSLEARLAAMPLQLPAGEQQQLLYQCAFAAGKKTFTRSLRSWQAAAAVLVVLLAGMSAPLARDEWLLAVQRTKPPVPAEVVPSPAPEKTAPPAMLVEELVPHRTLQVGSLELDAWQITHSEKNSFAEEMDHLKKSDPHLRLLTMGTLTRTILNP